MTESPFDKDSGLTIAEIDRAKVLKLLGGRDKVDLVFLPLERDATAFLKETVGFNKFIRAREPSLNVIFESDGAKFEIWNSKDYRIPRVLVYSVGLPIVLNLISSYLFEVLKAKPEDKVTLEIVVHDKGRKMDYSIKYSGPVEGMPKTPLDLEKVKPK